MDVLDTLTSTEELRLVSQGTKVWGDNTNWAGSHGDFNGGKNRRAAQEYKRLDKVKDFELLGNRELRSNWGPRKETKDKADC